MMCLAIYLQYTSKYRYIITITRAVGEWLTHVQITGIIHFNVFQISENLLVLHTQQSKVFWNCFPLEQFPRSVHVKTRVCFQLAHGKRRPLTGVHVDMGHFRAVVKQTATVVYQHYICIPSNQQSVHSYIRKVSGNMYVCMKENLVYNGK